MAIDKHFIISLVPFNGTKENQISFKYLELHYTKSNLGLSVIWNCKDEWKRVI